MRQSRGHSLFRRLVDAMRFDVDPVEQLSRSNFSEYARWLSAKNMERFCLLGLMLTILPWPTDLWVYQGQWGTVGVLALNRLVLVVALIGLHQLLVRSEVVRQHSGHAFIIFVGVVALWVSYTNRFVYDPSSPTRQPWFWVIYLLPFLTMFFVVDVRARIATTLATVAVAVGIFLPLNWQLLRVPVLAWPVGILTLSTVISIVMGEVGRTLLEAQFGQRRTLVARAEELAALADEKREFFEGLSHELRTPLTLLMGSLEGIKQLTVEQGQMPDATHSITVPARRNAGRLLHLVHQILELSRLDSGDLSLERRVVDVRAMMEQVVDCFQDATSRGRCIEVAGDDEVMAYLDPRRLQDVVFNLVSNAVKATDEREGTVRVEVVAEGRDVAVVVEDDGVGMTEEEAASAFNRFYGTGAQRHLGSGVGLAYAKRIVERHGGTISVRSVEGEGSCFRVVLPMGDARGSNEGASLSMRRYAEIVEAAPPSRVIERAPAGAPRVLVVEDHPDLRAYLHRLLSRRYVVDVASHGAEALVRGRACRPDLVLTDYSMPEMGGGELLERLRADDLLCRTPVIVLSARGTRGLQAELLAKGAWDFVAKPFEEPVLFARIELLIELARTRGEVEKVIGSLEEVNERLTARLAVEHDHVTTLLASIDKGRAGERQRIAREIHDELGQVLSGMRIELAIMREKGPNVMREHLAALRGLLERASSAVGDARRGRAPAVVAERGLGAGLEGLMGEVSQMSAVRTEMVCDGDLDQVPEELARDAYRIVQEATTNVIRHAMATRLVVVVKGDDEGLTLDVRDDGVGFVVGSTGRHGLTGMRERAEAAGGWFEVTSRRGDGTRVHAFLPIRRGRS